VIKCIAWRTVIGSAGCTPFIIDAVGSRAVPIPFVGSSAIVVETSRVSVARLASLSVASDQNGAGKSPVVHSIFGFADVYCGSIWLGTGNRLIDCAAISPPSSLPIQLGEILRDRSRPRPKLGEPTHRRGFNRA
jgi:hypothetical protein